MTLPCPPAERDFSSLLGTRAPPAAHLLTLTNASCTSMALKPYSVLMICTHASGWWCKRAMQPRRLTLHALSLCLRVVVDVRQGLVCQVVEARPALPPCFKSKTSKILRTCQLATVTHLYPIWCMLGAMLCSAPN